jgi:hypothetical protein
VTSQTGAGREARTCLMAKNKRRIRRRKPRQEVLKRLRFQAP